MRYKMFRQQVYSKYNVLSEYLLSTQKLLDAVYKISEHIYGKGFFAEYDEDMDRDTWVDNVLEENENLDSFPYEFPIYRGIILDSLNKLKQDDLGTHWTYDRDCADAYNNPEGKTDIYYLAMIISKDDIDWNQTLALLAGPHRDEKEISFKPQVTSRTFETFLYNEQWKVVDKFHGSIKRTWSDILRDQHLNEKSVGKKK